MSVEQVDAVDQRVDAVEELLNKLDKQVAGRRTKIYFILNF